MAGHPITACSVVNALGSDNRAVLRRLFEGVGGLTQRVSSAGATISHGRIDVDLEPLPQALQPYDTRQARLAWHGLAEIVPAIERAMGRWGASQVGMVIGTSTGGIAATEDAHAVARTSGRLPPAFDLRRQHGMDAILPVIRARVGLRGPAYVISTACSSSAKVFGSAQRLLATGRADAVLVGGIDTLCHLTRLGFAGLELLSPEPCRPLSARRSGINLGEGVAFALIEREGDGPSRLLGVGETSDAHHMSTPDPDGAGAKRAMQEALQQAGLDAAQVSLVNAHATGTRLNDAVECAAISSLLPGVPVVATKGYTGHLLGAAGATEIVFSTWAIEHGWVPASLGADPVDETLGVEVILSRSHYRGGVVLSNSFAFGGNNVCVALGEAAR